MERTTTDGQDVRHLSAPSATSAHYAFLNHSADTLPNNLPPTVDNKPLARQRRRRTSPEDQTVLEAAYARDPKPDKTARLELVKQVALGEKEVQIWFQNRRQSSRRRSRPLLPHEIAQYHLSRSYMASKQPQLDLLSTSDQSDDSVLSLDQPGDIRITIEQSSSVTEDVSKASDVTDTREQSPTSQVLKIPSCRSDATIDYTSAAGTKGIVGPVGFLANRRSASFRHPAETCNSFVSAVPAPERSESITQPYVASANVRLSMTSEGNAEIVTKHAALSSPPRLHNSQKSFDDSMTSEIKSSEGVPSREFRLQRTSNGRSRDSRAWQFWCDKDARVELEVKAEKDASGSAADAIGLMRSNSGRSILGAVPSKRNAFLSRPPPSTKRSKLDGPRPSLTKAYSAPSPVCPSGHKSQSRADKQTLCKFSDPNSVHVPNNESDKENWSPATDEIPSSDAISDIVPTAQHSALRKHARSAAQKRMSHPQGEDMYPDEGRFDANTDEEIRAFMQSGRKSSSISAVEDLDCIQGLLSLSQGNWR